MALLKKSDFDLIVKVAIGTAVGVVLVVPFATQLISRLKIGG